MRSASALITLGMPLPTIEYSNPASLQLLRGFSNPFQGQPNEFLGQAIERELAAEPHDTMGAEPAHDSILHKSRTWRAAYQRAQRGQAIPVPYPELRVTDPDKLEAMTRAYVDYRTGTLPQDALPDIRDVYPDGPYERAAMGVGTEPGLEPQALFIQACGQCHNERLDPSLSRARFNADVAELSRAQKDSAIQRLQLPPTDIRAMPPIQFRSLSTQARARMLEWLAH